MRFELRPMSMQRPRSNRRPLVGAAMVVLIVGLAALPGTAAVVSRSPRPVYQLPRSYYLALGDSIAFGFQPTKNPGARPSAFATGYVDVFAARLRKLSPKIQVVNYGCPGETSVTFTRGGCDWLKHGGELHDAFRGSQLKAVEAFLRAHPGKVSPITVTLWGADLAPLSSKGKHAQGAIASFAKRIASILRQLRATAPSSEIIVT